MYPISYFELQLDVVHETFLMPVVGQFSVRFDYVIGADVLGLLRSHSCTTGTDTLMYAPLIADVELISNSSGEF